MRNDARVREIVREEIQNAFKRAGISLKEDTPKKGSKVDTPHGAGVVLTLMHPNVRVRLNTGAVIKVNRNKVVSKN